MTGQSLTVVHPATGELLDLAGQPTDQLVELVTGAREYAAQVAEFRAQVEQVICDRMDRELSRTAIVGGHRLTVNAPTSDDWDLDRLDQVLAELVERGVITADAALAVIDQPPPKPQPERVVRAALNKLLKHPDPEVVAMLRECARAVPQRRTLKIERLS